MLLSKKGELHPDLPALFWCFHWTLWLCLLFVWVVCGLIWHIHKRNQPLYMSMAKMLQILVTYPTTWVHSRRLNHSRTLTGMLALVSVIVISSLHQSKLYPNLEINIFTCIQTKGDCVGIKLALVVAMVVLLCLLLFSINFMSAKHRLPVKYISYV